MSNSAAAFNLVRLNNTGNNLLKGIREPEFERRERNVIADGQGTLYRTGVSAIRDAPMARFQTISVYALNALIVAGGITAMPSLALDGTNGIELIAARNNDAGPGYKGGSVHARRQMKAGQLDLNSLSWRPNDVLVAACSAYGLSTDGDAAVVISDQVALPTLPLTSEQLVLSSLSFGGVTPPEVVSLDIDIGHQTANDNDEICYNTGHPSPILLAQTGVAGPAAVEATIEVLDLTSAPTSGGAMTAVFTAVSNLGMGLATNVVTAVINTSFIREVSLQGRPGHRRFHVIGTYDGTNRPFTLTNTP